MKKFLQGIWFKTSQFQKIWSTLRLIWSVPVVVCLLLFLLTVSVVKEMWNSALSWCKTAWFRISTCLMILGVFTVFWLAMGSENEWSPKFLLVVVGLGLLTASPFLYTMWGMTKDEWNEFISSSEAHKEL